MSVTQRTVAVCSLVVVSFLAFNPFLALLITGVTALYIGVSRAIFFTTAPFALALFFFFREYGVYWYSDAADDVPAYLAMYHASAELPFMGLFKRFFWGPESHELGWHVIWWVFHKMTGGAELAFVFSQYLFNFCLFGLLGFAVAGPKAPVVVLFFLLLFPESLYTAAHVWRQQVAVLLILAGAAHFYMREKHRWGRSLVYASLLFHLPCAVYIILFEAHSILIRRGVTSVWRWLLLAVVVFLALLFFVEYIFIVFDAVGYGRAYEYLVGGGAIRDAAVARTLIYMLLVTMALYFCSRDFGREVGEFESFVFFCVAATLSLPWVIAGANAVYDRYLIFAPPMIGLLIYLSLERQANLKTFIWLVLIAFCAGAARLYIWHYTLGRGVVSFLAYGNAFDPFMGVAKMLLYFDWPMLRS